MPRQSAAEITRKLSRNEIALAEIQKKLIDAGVSIYASSGITDGNGHFGYVIYFKEGDSEAAAHALAD